MGRRENREGKLQKQINARRRKKGRREEGKKGRREGGKEGRREGGKDVREIVVSRYFSCLKFSSFFRYGGFWGD